MKTRKYNHHYRLELKIRKKTIALFIAGFILGLALFCLLVFVNWAGFGKRAITLPTEEGIAPTATLKRDKEMSTVAKERLEVADTTGASSELIRYINKYSDRYGVSASYMVCLAKAESQFNPEAVGDHNLAIGIWQYHLGTWRLFRGQMGLSTEDLRDDEEESTKTTAWALSQGLDNHWTPLRRGDCRNLK